MASALLWSETKLLAREVMRGSMRSGGTRGCVDWAAAISTKVTSRGKRRKGEKREREGKSNIDGINTTILQYFNTVSILHQHYNIVSILCQYYINTVSILHQ